MCGPRPTAVSVTEPSGSSAILGEERRVSVERRNRALALAARGRRLAFGGTHRGSHAGEVVPGSAERGRVDRAAERVEVPCAVGGCGIEVAARLVGIAVDALRHAERRVELRLARSARALVAERLHHPPSVEQLVAGLRRARA